MFNHDPHQSRQSHHRRLHPSRRFLRFLAPAMLGLLALGLAACGDGQDGSAAVDLGGLDLDQGPGALSGLVVQIDDLPDFFTPPQLIDDFPLLEVLEQAVSAKFFLAYSDERSIEFLISGVAAIQSPEAVTEFFADPVIFLRAAFVDFDTIEVVQLEELGDNAVGIVYFPGGGGRQDIVIFRRGNVLGYVGLFKPIDEEGVIDIGRAAALMDQRIAEAISE